MLSFVEVETKKAVHQKQNVKSESRQSDTIHAIKQTHIKNRYYKHHVTKNHTQKHETLKKRYVLWDLTDLQMRID